MTMGWMAVAGVVWTCWGCKDENTVKKGKDEPWVVEIKSFERDELKVSDILARIDTVELYTDGKAMASIRDLCFLDSMVYILDASKAVSAFNLRTGRYASRYGRWDGGITSILCQTLLLQEAAGCT